MAAVVAALALGAAVAAIQILPFVEYLFLSRGYTWRQFAGLNPLAAPASTLITALVPRFLGEHYADTYAGPLNYLEQTMYAGIPVLILAVVGSAVGVAAPRRDWRAIFFAATGVLATLAVYGAPGVLQVISALPLVKGATLTRIPIVAITSAIVAAAFGVEALAARASDAERRRAMLAGTGAALAIAAAILAALTLQRSFLLRSMLSVETWRWSLWALLLAAGTGLALVAFARRHLERGPVVAALTALVALDLFVAGVGFHRLQPADRVYPAVAELTRLRGEPGPFRVVGAKGALMPNSALVYGLQDVRAYDGLGVAWYADLLDVALAWAQAHQQHELHARRLARARSARRPVPARAARVRRRPGALGADRRHDRAALSQPPRAAPRGARRWLRARRRRRPPPPARRRDRRAPRRAPRSRSRRLRIVRSAPPPRTRSAPRASPRTSTSASRSTRTRRDAACSCCRTRGSPAGARPSTGHPPDRARQRRLPRRPVPPGRHRVVFDYAPASFRIGATISGVALLLIAGWTALAERRRRPARLGRSLRAARACRSAASTRSRTGGCEDSSAPGAAADRRRDWSATGGAST